MLAHFRNTPPLPKKNSDFFFFFFKWYGVYRVVQAFRHDSRTPIKRLKQKMLISKI